jgi:predicted DNA-binding helix-hairpin-helix protein
MMSHFFYEKMNLKRVYYSGYVPISTDNRLPAMGTPVPMVRENRLYQADWLMRFYDFRFDEIVNEQHPVLDMDIDPKLSWALRNLDLFPVDINKADLQLIKRIPGIGVQSAGKIVAARRYRSLDWEHLKKIGISLSKARYFITCSSKDFERRDLQPMQIKQQILTIGSSKYKKNFSPQLIMF